MAMTAMLHISRRTTPHRTPWAVLTGWMSGRLRRRTAPVDVEALRQSLPLDDPDRHALESPVLEDAFAHLAADHPVEVTLASMRPADREQLLLAVRDVWFRHAHPGPERRWSPEVVTAYQRLMNDARTHGLPGGES